MFVDYFFTLIYVIANIIIKLDLRG